MDRVPAGMRWFEEDVLDGESKLVVDIRLVAALSWLTEIQVTARKQLPWRQAVWQTVTSRTSRGR